MIAVLGSRGGVGTTTLAVNLAATLAADPDNAVALIDLDLALGDADIALEVKGSRTSASPTWPRNIERLDMNFLRRAMAKHESDRAVDPAAPAGNRRGRPRSTRTRGAHPQPAQDQLHAPDARPEQALLPDRPDGPAHGRHDPAGRPVGTGQPAERGAADPLPRRRREPRRQDPRGHQPRVRTRSRKGSV